MSKIINRITAILLSVLMICSVFTAMPMTAFAEEIGNGATGDCTWKLDSNGTLTISGNGEMAGYSYDEYHQTTDAPWGNQITNVIIEDGVTSIGYGVFAGCTKLSSVTIPESVADIGSMAFYGCKGLTSITIPDGVTSIGYSAFYRCTNLAKVTIPRSMTIIGDSTFYECMRLSSVTIPDSVTSINDSAFCGCTGLTSITIPNSVMSIGNYAFHNCANLTKVTIANSMTNIGTQAFGYNYVYAYVAKVEHFTIYSKKNSEAENYAINNGFSFVNFIGDVNNDGNVNGADAGVLSRFAAGWKGYEDKIKNIAAADINGDGNVNGADAGILARYTSGWKQYDKYFES